MGGSRVVDYEYYFAKGYESTQQVDDFLRTRAKPDDGEQTIIVKMPTESMHSPADEPTPVYTAVPVSKATQQALDYYARLRADRLAI